MNCTRCDSRLSSNLSVQSYITALQSYITVLIYCTSGHCHQSHSKSGHSISVRRSQDGKKTHQKSYDERAGEMLMPVNQINQIYQLRRVCWNHFSFFSIIFPWFWFNLLPSATITMNISFYGLSNGVCLAVIWDYTPKYFPCKLPTQQFKFELSSKFREF